MRGGEPGALLVPLAPLARLGRASRPWCVALLGLAAGAACEAGASSSADMQPPAVADSVQVPAAPVRDTALEAAFRSVAAELDGVMGIAALHLQRDLIATHEGDRPFPLASVYKLPIAYAALHSGAVDPADSVRVEASDRAPGETPFAAGRHATIARLVERSLAHSDNTASDVLLRLAGGPAEVNRRMAALGIDGVQVDRSMKQVFAAWRGIRDTDGIAEWSLAEFDRRAAAVPAAERDRAQAGFADDLRDSGTARGVLVLLAALHRGDGLPSEARRLMLDALHGAVTGPNRIRAGVPPGTAVAEKTGTLGPLSHDAGIITLPEGRGDVALVVLVRSNAAVAARERAIAAVARLVWDRFAGDVATSTAAP